MWPKRVIEMGQLGNVPSICFVPNGCGVFAVTWRSPWNEPWLALFCAKPRHCTHYLALTKIFGASPAFGELGRKKGTKDPTGTP